MAVPTVIAAGLAQVPWRRWFPPVVVGELIWTGSLLLVGYYATESIMRSEWAVVQFGIIVSVVLFVLMVLYVLRKAQQDKKAH
jgi:membrane protein DedA with SNARE-associated domain